MNLLFWIVVDIRLKTQILYSGSTTSTMQSVTSELLLCHLFKHGNHHFSIVTNIYRQLVFSLDALKVRPIPSC